jgi:glycosyltransferase involved in cell wall biosynthesis
MKGHEVTVLTLDVNEEDEFWADPLPSNCIMRFGPCSYDGRIKVRRYRRSLPIDWVHRSLYVFLDKVLGIYFYGPHSWKMYKKMFNEIKKCDIVHTHTVPYPHNYISFMEAKLARKKIVITPHFHTGHPHYERLSFYILLKLCDSVITVSNYERDYLIKKGVNPKKIFVTGNGVEPELYKPKNYEEFEKKLSGYGIDHETKLVVFIGRKADYKGVDTLIEAAKKLLKNRKDIKFVLAGPGNPWFNKLYETLSSEEKNKIIDMGFLSETEKVNLLHRADLLCLPSKFEAFGIVFLEAWICNTPVIGSDKGAQPSVIEDAGLTFRFGDAEELAKKILYIIDNDEIAKKMADKGKRMIMEKYTWSKIGEKVLAVYEGFSQEKSGGK